MLLIHTPKLTNRLGYTLNVLFQHVLHADFSITTDEQYYLQYGGAKLNYGSRRLGDGLFIKAQGLLSETSIEEQEPHAECRDGMWMMYPVYGRDLDLPFDPLAATFFLVTRYEEHLPHREDEHGRFSAAQSIAAQAGFLDQPVVEQWALLIRGRLLERYPDLTLPERHFRYIQTVDIDAAWAFLHKGTFRSVTGFFRDLVARRDPAEAARRIRVLLHREPDPSDSFDYLIQTVRSVPGATLIFFVLLADYGEFDKPASYLNPHYRELIQHLGDYAKMGIHPGYSTIDQPAKADIETKRLDDILHRPTVRARYHFLRLQHPLSYRILQRAGIREDYTMGYADTLGFRAGISSAYPFYDLERDHETELLIQPFCVTDSTLQRYLRLTPEEGLEQYKRLIDTLRAVGGTFCPLIHNQNLSDLYGWKGWRHTFEQMLDYLKQEPTTSSL